MTTDTMKQLHYLAGALKAPRILESAARLADQARDDLAPVTRAGWGRCDVQPTGSPASPRPTNVAGYQPNWDDCATTG